MADQRNTEMPSAPSNAASQNGKVGRPPTPAELVIPKHDGALWLRHHAVNSPSPALRHPPP